MKNRDSKEEKGKAVKKAISLFSCFLLGGCITPYQHVDVGPAYGTNFPYQDTAPLPWVSVIPSERAIACKEIDFDIIAHQLRYNMSYNPHRNKFKNVGRVLVDYAILPPEDFMKSDMQVKKGGQTYPCVFEKKPEQYILTMRFYGCDQSLSGSPLIEETITMPSHIAPPQEAMHLMVHTLVEDIHFSSLKKIHTDLN